MVIQTWLPEFVAGIALILAAGAETWHAARTRRVAKLAFGPRGRASAWTLLAAPLRVVSLTLLCWGLLSLLIVTPRVLEAEALEEDEYKHIIMVLDVSPSMRLQDAGPDAIQSRMERAADVLESFFKRVVMKQYRVSVVAFYTGAKAVVIDTSDLDVVRNIMRDLPMQYAFTTGDTDLFAGLLAAAEIAQPWNPKSTTILVISDGDTVPATGMPRMPAAVRDVVVVGVGDSRAGSFINGKQSRQETSTLRQVAVRLGGTYHNGNKRHLSSELISQLTETTGNSPLEKFTRREWALVACAVGAVLYALLPVLLELCGTPWRPGVPARVARADDTAPAGRTLPADTATRV